MTYGVDYSACNIECLPVAPTDDEPFSNSNQQESKNANAIRLLPPPLFASFHLDHLVSHPPDHILFPFLHGLEGENDAQNTFFANANVVVNTTEGADPSLSSCGGSHHVVNVTIPGTTQPHRGPQDGLKKDSVPPPFSVGPQATTTTHQLLRPKVPQYRGLVWVVCEDDLKDDKVALSVLRRKPIPSATTGSTTSDGMILDDSDDAMLSSSDDDLDDDDTTSSDSESSSFGDDEDLDDLAVHDSTHDDFGVSSDSQTDEDRGIMSSVSSDDISPLGKPLSKAELDSMSYMHPVVMPHHPHSPQFASLPAIDTRGIAVSTSVSSSSGSEVESVFTAATMTPTTGTASTSVSGSPVSPSPNNGATYGHPQVIKLEEVQHVSPGGAAAHEREHSQIGDSARGHFGDGSSKMKTAPPHKLRTKRKSKSKSDPAAPPLLTCSFRPKELLKKKRAKASAGGGKNQDVWEFVPARVPEGISLRNFGIQVPVYATLSDIVIYSPKGVTPNALALARRFREAIDRKRQERITALKGIVYSQVHAHTQTYKTHRANTAPIIKAQHHHITAESLLSHENSSQEEEDDIETKLLDAAERYLLSRVEEEMLEYNVFILDADERQMRKRIGHLMMHSCGSGIPGVEKPDAKMGAHTIGSDGRLVEETVIEKGSDAPTDSRMEDGMDLVMGDIELDAEPTPVEDSDVKMSDAAPVGERVDDASSDISDANEPIPNTVDFALREREEMRDLTKASEIISIFPATASPSITPTRATFMKGSLFDSPLSLTPSGTPVMGGPPHLQHLPNLVPASPPPSSYQTIPAPLSSNPTEFIYSHPDPTIDISSPATFYDPKVGQVYLGNAGDVPLVSEATTIGSQESARSRLEDVNADEMAPEDPFNYTATNNPKQGFGYDICIECHELAPFPTAAHLRAAEEHLVTLERVWRERVVRREMENLRNEVELAERDMSRDGSSDGSRVETKTLRVPPRPPPNANAIIHLPFPSSPPNSQATLAQLIPVMRFLERWIRPVSDVTVDVQVEVTPLPTEKSTSSDGVEDVDGAPANQSAGGVRRWSSSVVASILPGVFGSSSSQAPPASAPPTSAVQRSSPSPPPSSSRTRSNTTPASTSSAVSAFYQPQQSSLAAPHSASYQPRRYQPPAPPPPQRLNPTRPLKVLIYSADGYTESSLPSLCLLMSVKGLNLPEAYLDLQVAKRRSFFVYQHDLGILKRVEGRLREERERERERLREAERQRELREIQIAAQRERERAERERNERDRDASGMGGNGNGKRSLGGSFFRGFGMGQNPSAPSGTPQTQPAQATAPPVGERRTKMGRPSAKSVSFTQAPGLQASSSNSNVGVFTRQKNANVTVNGQQQQPPPPIAHQPGHVQEFAKAGHAATLPPPPIPGHVASSSVQGGAKPQYSATRAQGGAVGRPRANTSPWLPSVIGGDHQSWFNDPRFDGSFPSRVLPFLYLGNLNHASNVYMLHALGITHVVSVGECALLPPPFHMVGHGNGGGGNGSSSARAFKQANPNTSGHGSLWIEEREGRIKVLDIQGVCDDGIDTLEPQLEPICEWIDKARAEGGQVLVHCRVGVSRSATVTIAYVMKHLSLPLVDAYLIVRSRRLSVLIQPNMRLLYNLCGWEVKLAKDRAALPDTGDAAATQSPEDEEKKKRILKKRLRKELARTLPWPYLSKEVHALNEKYLH